MKRISFFLLTIMLCASLAYAGNLHNPTDIGVDGSSYGSYALRLWGGGSDCTCTIGSGAHMTGLQCPFFYIEKMYDPSATTVVTYYRWFSPVTGKWKISSGATGDSETGYGIPTDVGFDIEASGASM